MTINTVQVNSETFIDPTRSIYSPVDLNSDTWFFWLKDPDVKSFHYESEVGKFTARKEQRSTSTNEYWYAYRKIGGKLRKVYLGALEELTSDRLEQVAREISQPGWEFYSSRKSYTTKNKESCVTQVVETQSYTTNEQSSCVTSNSEVEELRAEVENLQSRLVVAQEVIASWANRWSVTDRSGQSLGRANQELEKLNEQLRGEAKSISVTLRGVINYLESLVETGRLTQRLRDGLKPKPIFPLESIIKKLKSYYD